MINEKILVPVDFSECSIDALKVAVGIANSLGSDLLILHAYHLSVVEGQYGVGFLAERMAKDKRHVIDAQFKILEEKVPELSSVTYELLSRHGSVDDEVMSLIEAAKIYMVIMGTKGVSGIDEVLIGSNAYSVIKKTEVPVLLIPEGGSLKKIKSIALAGDYKPLTTHTLDILKELTQVYDAQAYIIHIDDDAVLETSEINQAVKFEEILKGIRYHYRLLTGKNVEKGIRDYCETNEIDLLAIVPRRQQLLDAIFGISETKKIVFHTQLPVLILPEAKRSL